MSKNAIIPQTPVTKFECLNQDNDTKLNKIRSQVEQHLEERAAGCISVDFEFDDEIYKDFGSNITTVTNWFTSLFNHKPHH